MTSHTKGPWRYGQPTEFGTMSCGLVYDAATSDVVAQLSGIPVNGTVEELPEKFAPYIQRGRLIASAPELLEALRSIAAYPIEDFSAYNNAPDERQIFGANGEWALTVGDVRRARAAIAKATGDTP